MLLPIHTNGSLPVKIPVPPLSCVDLSPVTSQLNPTRGEKSGVVSGSLL